MKLKQDVESSWKCPFVSVSEEESGAQGESPTLTQQALAFFLVHIHKTTHAKIRGFEVVLFGCSLGAHDAV